MAALNLTIGNKTALYFAVLDPVTQAADPFVVPSTVAITTSALFASAATTIAVTALPGPIPAGTAIKLTTVSPAASVTVYTSAPSASGATALTVLPTSAGLGTAATGSYVPKLLLQGGTTSSPQITSQNTETKVYGQELTYADGAITSASWMVDYTSNFLPSDPAFYRLTYAAQYAVSGVAGYLWFYYPPYAGKTLGQGMAGVVQLESFSATAPADGIVTVTTKFLGRGTPVLTPEVA